MKPHAQPAANPSILQRLTAFAFILALALVVARVTMSDFSKARNEPMLSDSPRGVGSAAALGLDLLACIPALLILARRVADKHYVLRAPWSAAPFAALALWSIVSAAWSADQFAALIGGFQLLAAFALFWAAIQLVRSWLRLRILASILVGLLLAYFTFSLFYRTVDVPDLQKSWADNKAQFLKDHGLAGDPFLADQFEKRVLSGELMGFYTSPNSMAAIVVLLLLVTVGMALQRRNDQADDPVAWALLLTIPLAAWMIYYTQSRTAYVTPLVGLIALALAWHFRTALAANAKPAYWIAIAILLLGTAAVSGYGLARGNLIQESLTFRLRYWLGSAHIIAKHPVLGVGMENFGAHYLAARRPDAAEEIKDPHNLLVRITTELGLIGAILCILWLARLTWEITRPHKPPTPLPSANTPRGLRAILLPISIATLGIFLNILVSVDFSADGGFVFNEILRRTNMLALLLIGACVAAIPIIKEPTLDDRPAPLVLYALIICLLIFLLHNTIDFSFFEAGPQWLFAFIAGSLVGVRQPSLAGHRKNTLAVGATLAVVNVAFLLIGAFVWVPTLMAENALVDAQTALKTNRPNEAVRILNIARADQPLNAEYAYRAAQIMIGATNAYSPQVLDLLQSAIRANPMAIEYYLTRARYLLNSPNPDPPQIKSDFTHALAINPNDAATHVEYADALIRLSPPDREQAIQQYQQAIQINNQLLPNEPKRMAFQKRIPQINQSIESLRNAPSTNTSDHGTSVGH